MANRTTYTQAHATLASLCDRVAETREPYIIETAHLLRSPKNAARLATVLERAHGGKPAPPRAPGGFSF